MDEGRILEIIKTRASEGDLVEALERLHADNAIAKQVKHQPSARVSELREILGRHDVALDEGQNQGMRAPPCLTRRSGIDDWMDATPGTLVSRPTRNSSNSLSPVVAMRKR
jgi:hypothetical protein